MGAKEYISKIRSLYPAILSEELLELIEYKDSGEDDFEKLSDANYEFRSEVLYELKDNFTKEDRNFIRLLAEAERKSCEADEMATEELKLACFMLYVIGDKSDEEFLRKAKQETSFDAENSIDETMLDFDSPDREEYISSMKKFFKIK